MIIRENKIGILIFQLILNSLAQEKKLWWYNDRDCTTLIHFVVKLFVLTSKIGYYNSRTPGSLLFHVEDNRQVTAFVKSNQTTVR